MKLGDLILDLFGPLPEPDRPSPAPAVAAPAKAEPAAEPGGRDEAAVLAVLQRAGAGYRGVVFTRNRRVMISVGRDRAVIRLHGAFASAPDEVLLAVGALYSRTRGRKRDEARETVRSFIATLPTPSTPPAPRKRWTHPGDLLLVQRLQAEFDRVNRASFGGRLPRVPIHLSRVMRSRNGHFSSRPLEIVISHRLCTHGAPGEAEETVRHEMVHLWQYVEGMAVDHGPVFRRMAKRLDVHPRATRQVRWKGGQR